MKMNLILLLRNEINCIYKKFRDRENENSDEDIDIVLGIRRLK